MVEKSLLNLNHSKIKINIMKVKFINSWLSKVKQYDKINITVRISSVTVLRIDGDWSRRELDITLFNFKWEFRK